MSMHILHAYIPAQAHPTFHPALCSCRLVTKSLSPVLTANPADVKPAPGPCDGGKKSNNQSLSQPRNPSVGWAKFLKFRFSAL